jgi:hypothetical protein
MKTCDGKRPVNSRSKTHVVGNRILLSRVTAEEWDQSGRGGIHTCTITCVRGHITAHRLEGSIMAAKDSPYVNYQAGDGQRVSCK